MMLAGRPVTAVNTVSLVVDTSVGRPIMLFTFRTVRRERDPACSVLLRTGEGVPAGDAERETAGEGDGLVGSKKDAREMSTGPDIGVLGAGERDRGLGAARCSELEAALGAAERDMLIVDRLRWNANEMGERDCRCCSFRATQPSAPCTPGTSG